MEPQPSGGVRAKFAQEPALHDTIALLFNMYEILCPALLEHSRELARTCEGFAVALGWDEDQAKVAYLAGLFHDVGHLMAPSNIANWKGETPPRVDMATKHPSLGERLLHRVGCLQEILPAVRHHHENFNGNGFPDGLAGEDIPPLARLVTVAHEYQTLLRGYDTTPPLSDREAREVIAEDAGVILDPEMVKVFLAHLPPVGKEKKK
ncbi:MAG: HD domain-containing protein [Deltaproteobacteria bacterium]|nr:HD domain-containing protein [Deltaproteobacteria bacterium]MCB2186321.1 HD domain-containing protein [Deltaproteobacteria bacterium]